MAHAGRPLALIYELRRSKREARSLQRRSAMTAALLGCPIRYEWISTANPYRFEQTVVLVFLLFGLLGWRRVQPQPGPLIRGYILFASMTVVALSTLQGAGSLREARETCWLVLHVASGLALCLYGEILSTVRQRRETALAAMRVISQSR